MRVSWRTMVWCSRVSCRQVMAQFAGDEGRPMLAVLEQDGDVVGVDPVGLGLADALGDLLGGLDGIEDGHVVAVADQEVVQAVPVVAGGLHGDGHLGEARRLPAAGRGSAGSPRRRW